MYAILIGNLLPTSGLAEKVPYHAWTKQKPDVSHLRVFGSIGYANIPKKLRGGKLEVTSVKCRLLGWGEDSKGYRLEDLETKRVFISRDVRFIEDESPTEMAVLDNAKPREPQLLEEIADELSADLPTPPIQGTSETNPKVSKWADLPQREPSSRAKKAAKMFGEKATEEDIEEALGHHVEHRAYIAYANEPKTYQEAKASPCSKQWEKAISDEIAQLKATGTFEWVKEVPKDRKVVGSRWVFKEKRDEKGNLAKYKARVVAQGFSQVPGQDFNATFASVAKFVTLHVLLALCAREDWELHQVDVKSTYLQGDLEEEIYMRVPEGAVEPGKEGWVWRLLKAIYGLKQAGRQWKKRLDTIMKELGFNKSAADDCLYIKTVDGLIEVVVLVYVDDMTVAGPKLKHVEDFKRDIAKQVTVMDMGELRFILGIEVTRNRAMRTITCNQTAYIREVLTRYGMQDCATVTTPLVAKE